MFKPSHDIYEMEQRKGATLMGVSTANNSFKGDVTIDGNLTVREINASGGVKIDGGLVVSGGASFDDVDISGNLNLTSTSWTYNGDPDIDGSFRSAIVAGQLITYKRISGNWVEQLAIGENV